MSNKLLCSSIGKKLIMSLSGFFLILFLIFHVSMNLTAIFSAEFYNWICAILGANWYALVGTAVLAFGVLVHFIYAFIITLQNLRARGGAQRYAVTSSHKEVSWASRNMFVLGLIVLGGLIIHLFNFWYNMQLVDIMGNHEFAIISPTDGAAHIAYIFSQPIYCIIYLLWFAALWFHLTHGFWSMFQTVGWNNKIWLKRLKIVANVFATLLMLGFASVVVVFFLRSIGACGIAC